MQPRENLQFFVNGQLQTISAPPPTLTILDWLRDNAGLTGTKEGCAEGDCGACTVVVAELVEGAVQLRSINACIQFLVTLDGRELITVEGLQGAEGSLHPVQNAMVAQHASQCGFCTPGFVMSLFVLYKAQTCANREQVSRALSGNLCRCTGYRPIIDAALTMFTPARHNNDWRFQPGTDQASLSDVAARLNSIRPQQMLQIETAAGCYWAPHSCDQLLALTAAHPAATLLAGGTDIGLWVTKSFRSLPEIIYLGEVEELQQIKVSDDAIVIGAGVSLTRAFQELSTAIPGLDEVFRRFASPPICNAGTLAGNVANGSPIGDSMPVLLVLGTQLTLSCSAGNRQLPLTDFYKGYQRTDLQPGEVVTSIRIPLPAADTLVRCYKIAKRFDQDISGLLGAFAVQFDGVRVARVAVAFGGMAAVPARAVRAEAALLDQPWTAATIERAAAALADDFSPISDLRASAGYRAEVAGNLLRKLFTQTQDGAPDARVFDVRPVQV